MSSLDGFDSFYGEDDFAHSHNWNQVVVKQGEDLVCHSEEVTIIQQRLAVIQEMAKKCVSSLLRCILFEHLVLSCAFQNHHRANLRN
jgi:hypothetical protein